MVKMQIMSRDCQVEVKTRYDSKHMMSAGTLGICMHSSGWSLWRLFLSLSLLSGKCVCGQL